MNVKCIRKKMSLPIGKGLGFRIPFSRSTLSPSRIDQFCKSFFLKELNNGKET